MEQESDNTAVKIVGIIGGVVVVIVLACGVMGYFIIKTAKETVGKAMESMEAWTQDMQQSESVAQAFLNQIQVNNLEAAYESTTESFKKRLSRKDLDELVKKYPALKEPATNMGMDMSTPMAPPTSPQSLPSTYRYQFHAQTKDGKDQIDLTVAVSKDGGAMKVDSLTIKKTENIGQGENPP
jgi:hypothetical protein